MWITLVIRQRIPAVAVSERKMNGNKGHQRRSPPTAMTVVMTTRTPGPVVVVVDPTTVVIGGPAPRFISHPCPTVRWAPGPVSITIRRPIIVDIYYCCAGPPNPPVVGGIGPISIGIEILSSPHVLVVVLSIVPQALGQIAFAITDPTIQRIGGCSGQELPVAGICSIVNELGRTTVSQCEARSV